MDLNKLKQYFPSFILMDGEDFLRRERNTFDTGLPLVLENIVNDSQTEKKIADIFGEREIERNNGYIVVKALPLFERKRFSFGDLIEILHRLRDEDGCPWDRAQTNKSIRANILEEAYELCEAVDLDDTAKMREECGDVILQGALSAVIAGDDNRFTADDAVTDLCVKLISRHTHIFGSDRAYSAEDALSFWDKAKAKEKKYVSVLDKIESIPITFNALMKANKVQKVIKKTGFDFSNIQEAAAKISEEVEEFLSANDAEREMEAGDVLFAAVNLVRMGKVDPEIALNLSTDKFIRRFTYVLDRVKEEGRSIEELSLDEMEKYYQEGKAKEHQ